MTKTSVYLSDRERERLAALSRLTGKSQAEVIREAIAQYQPEMEGDRDFALARVVNVPGPSVAELSDDELMRGFGE